MSSDFCRKHRSETRCRSLKFVLAMLFEPHELQILFKDQECMWTSPTYGMAARKVLQSEDLWKTCSKMISDRLPEGSEALERLPVLDLLDIFNTSAGSMGPTRLAALLWSVIKRRERCPAKICRWLNEECEVLGLRALALKESA